MTSSAQLQREADAARVGLADTLVQLRDGMAPAALSGEALALAKDTGLSLVKTLSEQARANPVPALLIGAGLVMLLTRTTGGDVASVAGSAFRSAASTGANAARQAASAAGQAVKGAASTGREALSSAAGVLREEVAQADLGGKAWELADKVVEGVAGGSAGGLARTTKIDAENKKGMSTGHPAIGS